MRHRLISAALLLILSCGLILGHLPCQSGDAAQEVDTGGEMACHAAKDPADSPALKDDSPAGGHGCCSDEHGVCRHACHMVADMGAMAPRFAAQISARVLLVPVSRSLSLHPQPIDHIPLS